VDKKRIKEKLEFRKTILEEERKAYLELLRGGVKSYGIGSRNLTKFDLPELEERIRKHENEIEELERLLEGGARRRTVGVIPRDF
jgi:hypothetical protein